MWRRRLAGLLAAFNVLNGLIMLAFSKHWYDAVPGVALTGPFNRHFVEDIGAAFLAAGFGLVARAWRTRYWPAALAGAAFLALHALIHLTMAVAMTLGLGSDQTWGFDIALVIAPAAFALFVCFPGQGESYA